MNSKTLKKSKSKRLPVLPSWPLKKLFKQAFSPFNIKNAGSIQKLFPGKTRNSAKISCMHFPLYHLDPGDLGRVPFNQNSRFEFPKFSYVEWNGIFHQAGPISFYSHQESLGKVLKDRDEVSVLSAVLSCFMWRSLTRIQNSTLRWHLWEKLTNFSRGRVRKPGELTTGNWERPIQIFSRKSDPNDFVVDQEQARTMADHFAFSVVLTRKTRRHLVAFHR